MYVTTTIHHARGEKASRDPDPLPRTVVGQWDKTYCCYGSIQTLTLSSDSVLRLMRIAHARFMSDTTHCRMVTSKFVFLATAPDDGSGPYLDFNVLSERDRRTNRQTD